jgi:hypothetical protein
MAKKKDARSIMRQHLGKEVGDAMLSRVDDMLKRGASAEAIEKAFARDLTAHIEKLVVSAVITNIGPLQPISVKPIQSSVKSAIAPAVGVSSRSVSSRTGVGWRVASTSSKTGVGSVGIKTGPGRYTKGPK